MSRSEAAKLWQERLRRFDRSQMTVAQFCLNEGISQPSFYQWKKKLRQHSGDTKSKPTATGVQFMPLRLTADTGHHVAPELREQVKPALASTTIELPGGVRIRVEVPTYRQPSELSEVRT